MVSRVTPSGPAEAAISVLELEARSTCTGYVQQLRENNAQLWQINHEMQIAFEQILDHTRSLNKPRGSVLLEIHRAAVKGRDVGESYTYIPHDVAKAANQEATDERGR